MLLRCESLEPPMSQMGQNRPWRHVRVESVLPPASDIGRRRRHGSSVHRTGLPLRRLTTPDSGPWPIKLAGDERADTRSGLRAILLALEGPGSAPMR